MKCCSLLLLVVVFSATSAFAGPKSKISDDVAAKAANNVAAAESDGVDCATATSNVEITYCASEIYKRVRLNHAKTVITVRSYLVAEVKKAEKALAEAKAKSKQFGMEERDLALAQATLTEFRTSQLRFREYYKAECQWDSASWGDGSGRNLAYFGCLSEMLRARNGSLSRQYNDLRGE